MKIVKNGNKRFMEGRSIHPRADKDRRLELVNIQRPLAVILSCSDSRLPPELIFDAGLGDLFVLRVGGNIINSEIIASIEFAVKVLMVKLVIVMGHENCGTVIARQKNSTYGHIKKITKFINPAYKKAKKLGGDLLITTTKEKDKLVVNKLKKSKPILYPAVKKGELKIIPAFYELSEGKVTFELD